MSHSLSVSILSEASKDEAETEDKELQELVLNLMNRSGLLAEMQGRISKFIEENGKNDNITIFRERADPRLLGLIFEYLQWVGMKQTNSVLLSESPVPVDLSIYESRSQGEDYKPNLYKYMEERNETEDEDRMTSKSQNYSKDEFEDSRVSSISAHPSGKANEEDEIEDLATDDNDPHESEGSDCKQSFSNINKSAVSITKNPPDKNQNNDTNIQDGGHTDTLIDLNSPKADQNRPNVTVRQRVVETGSVSPDPFQSPRNTGTIDLPNFSSTPFSIDRQGILEPYKTFDEGGRNENIKPVIINEEQTDGRGDNNFFQSVVENPSAIKESHSKPVVQTSEKKSARDSPEDDSTSDFMETLTMEEDTQDISIPSDSKGMSSCEHVVNFFK